MLDRAVKKDRFAQP